MKEPVQCPFCLGYETELYALFGQWLSTSQYYCRSCRTVFEWIKWEGEGAALTPPDGTPLP
ncbi:MAG: hypothetical protein NZ610_08095 [Candidatus Bipolaricaulota bacterium]|nr:hypothetical protein [Candidatus Bipolaricaulota bacterium]MDW8329196.1 hypothetical protein [Candidatus Bipolaricaulota bacterium]